MTETSPEQEAYRALLRAQNYKGALVSLQEASEHLERAENPALNKQCKELGRAIVTAAFEEFHEEYPELWKDFEGREQ